MLTPSQLNAMEAAQGFLVLAIAIFLSAAAARSRFDERATARIIWPLLAATWVWFGEYALKFALPVSLGATVADRIANTLVSLGFLFCGWSLLTLQGRVHPVLLPPLELRPRWKVVQRIFGHRAVLHALGLLMVAFLALSLGLDLRQAAGADSLADTLQSISGFLGLLLLGLGLGRELTRVGRDWVARACSSSLLFYAVLQLFQDVPRDSVAFVVTRTLAIVFKVTFLVSLSAYWAMVCESRRALRDRLSVVEGVLRSLSLIVGRLHTHISPEANTLVRAVEKARHDHGRAPGRARDLLYPIEESARRLDEMLRELIDTAHETLDEETCPGGLAAALVGRLDLMRTRFDGRGATLRLDLRVHPQPFPRLPVEVENAFFRIAAEAMSNIEKHSHAARVEVSLELGTQHLLMEIGDDGVGLPEGGPVLKGRHGIASMERSAQYVGANVYVGPGHDGRGTRVEASWARSVALRGDGNDG